VYHNPGSQNIVTSKKRTYIGIDPSSGHEPYIFAALNEDCHLLKLAAGTLEEVFTFIECQEATLVAVNSAQSVNKGVVRKEIEKRNLNPGHLRGTEMRMAEYELRNHNIFISPTPSRIEVCAAWMQVGFDFYHKMDRMGFKPYPTNKENHLWLETHPHAAFCALLGQLPLPKPTLEGRLQRQLLLHEHTVGIKDPMEFFEEITRHRLLKGVLPMEFIYSAEELDALVAAFTAYKVSTKPSEVLWIGNKQEGQIVLPISTLKEIYS
jgi:hypothetical protein